MLTGLDRMEIKGVTRLAVRKAGGQENAAGVSSRITRPATFSDYANPNAETIIALDAAIELDQFNGEPLLLGKAASYLGFHLYRRPAVTAAASDEAGLLRAAKEGTEAIAKAWADRADGVVTPAERAEEITQIDEAVVALLELRARLSGEI